ncbi:hypothetical protein INR49_028258 [Caranx melampygus]|nr:hypothetical protein INR49_028258 [Caranx melampygus]
MSRLSRTHALAALLTLWAHSREARAGCELQALGPSTTTLAPLWGSAGRRAGKNAAPEPREETEGGTPLIGITASLSASIKTLP